MNSATQITSARPLFESIIQAASEKLSNKLNAIMHRYQNDKNYSTFTDLLNTA